MQQSFESVKLLSICLRPYVKKKPTERCTLLQHKGTLYNGWVPLITAALDRDGRILDADPPWWHPGSSK